MPPRKDYITPISIFVNTTRTGAAHREHWVHDIGENGDLSVNAAICNNIRDVVATFRDLPNAKGSFATKLVNPELLSYDP